MQTNMSNVPKCMVYDTFMSAPIYQRFFAQKTNSLQKMVKIGS